MARESYVFDKDSGQLVPKDEFYYKKSLWKKTSALGCPYSIITDSMEPVKSMLDGKYYDSKSKLRRTYKEAGMIEVGSNPPMEKKPKAPVDKKGIRESVQKAFAKKGII